MAKPFCLFTSCVLAARIEPQGQDIPCPMHEISVEALI